MVITPACRRLSATPQSRTSSTQHVHGHQLHRCAGSGLRHTTVWPSDAWVAATQALGSCHMKCMQHEVHKPAASKLSCNYLCMPLHALCQIHSINAVQGPVASVEHLCRPVQLLCTTETARGRQLTAASILLPWLPCTRHHDLSAWYTAMDAVKGLSCSCCTA